MVWLTAVLRNQIAIERFCKFVTLTTDRPHPNWQPYEIILPQSNFVTLHPGDSGQQADGLIFEHPIYEIISPQHNFVNWCPLDHTDHRQNNINWKPTSHFL